MAAAPSQHDSLATLGGDLDRDLRGHATVAAAMSSSPPSPIQFMLEYEHMQDAEAEAAYAQQSTRRRVATGVGFATLALVALYAFLVAIKLVGEGATLLLSCRSREAFAFTDSPFAGLLLGTATTALLHSSSTVTSTTVAVVGAGAMTVRQGVFVVMGANVGTCVTCMMVAFGHVGHCVRFQRAMAAATLHDMYNVASVLVLFPLEVFFHPLEKLSLALADAHTAGGGGNFTSPLDALVDPLADAVLRVDEKRLYAVASGTRRCGDVETFIRSGAFYDVGWSDAAVGGTVASLGLLLLLASLVALVRTLAHVFLGPTKRAIARLLRCNGYAGIAGGVALTFVVHSSTVVTSTLTPMAGHNVITLEQVYPIMLGANLGTTTNALLASLVTGKNVAVALALTHVFFNVAGLLLFFPIEATRRPIFQWARSLAYYSASWPIVAVIFLTVGFFVAPAIGLSLVYMCTASDAAVVAVGYGLLVLLLVHGVVLAAWYYRHGGRNTWQDLLERKRVEREIRKYGGNLGRPSFVDDTSENEYDDA